MIALTTRKEILESNKIIRSEISKMQKAFYDEENLQSYKDTNEEHLFWEMFDTLDGKTSDIKIEHKIISLNHTDITTFTKKLSNKLLEIFKFINAKDFIIISHLKLDFFGNRDNNFKPLVNSYKKLEEFVGSNSYKEAFCFSSSDLEDFIDILFWLTRCDPGVAEYIFLFDKNEKIQINLCKYGNIHLTEFGNAQLTHEALSNLGFAIINGQEYDNFSEDGKINGREIKI